MADYFVICSGGSERQLGAIGDGVAEKLRAEGVRPIGREGGSNSHWDTARLRSRDCAHLRPPERDYYQLERHWAKGKTVLRVSRPSEAGEPPARVLLEPTGAIGWNQT